MFQGPPADPEGQPGKDVLVATLSHDAVSAASGEKIA